MANNPNFLISLALKALERVELKHNYVSNLVVNLTTTLDEQGCPTDEQFGQFVDQHQEILDILDTTQQATSIISSFLTPTRIIITNLDRLITLLEIAPIPNQFTTVGLTNKLANFLRDFKEKNEDTLEYINEVTRILGIINNTILAITTLAVSLESAIEKKRKDCEEGPFDDGRLLEEYENGDDVVGILLPEPVTEYALWRNALYGTYDFLYNYYLNLVGPDDDVTKEWKEKRDAPQKWLTQYGWGANGRQAQILDWFQVLTADQIEFDYDQEMVSLHCTPIGKHRFERWDGRTVYPRFKKGSIRSTPLPNTGTISAEIKLPKGQNLWSAYWILSSTENPPVTLEIDMFEAYTGTDNYDPEGIGDLTVNLNPTSPITTTKHFKIINSNGEVEKRTDSNYAEQYFPSIDPSENFIEYSVVLSNNRITCWAAYTDNDGNYVEELMDDYPTDSNYNLSWTLYFNTGVTFSVGYKKRESQGTTSPMQVKNVQFHDFTTHVPPSQQPRYNRSGAFVFEEPTGNTGTTFGTTGSISGGGGTGGGRGGSSTSGSRGG